MSLKMTTMWTNFVKFGDPTPPDLSLDFTWEAATQEDLRYWGWQWQGLRRDFKLTFIILLFRYLIIDDEMKMGMDDDYVSRMAFWDSIF